MSEEFNELDNMVVLTDEEGNDVAFEFIDLIAYEGAEYVVLLPAEDEDNEVVILKVEDGDTDEENYVSVDDEDTLMAVFDIFKEKFKDEFTFEEE